MNYLALAGAAGVLVFGGLCGAALQKDLDNRVLDRCSQDVRKLKTTRCPAQIADAFAAVKLGVVIHDVEVRDKFVPVIIKDSAEDRRRNEALLDAIAELSKEAPDETCSHSAALERRRLQLCASEGGPGCPADVPAPQAER